MPPPMNEDILEQAALAWLAAQGYRLAHGPDLAPGMPASRKQSKCWRSPDVTAHSTEADAHIVEALATSLCGRITRRAIRILRQFPAGLSGDDSDLQNVWDEICIQLQSGEESYAWNAYEDEAARLLTALVMELPDHERTAVWLQTERAEEWRIDYDCQDPDDEPMDETPPVNIDEIVAYLLARHLWPAADTYSNRRIRAFLDGAARTRMDLEQALYVRSH